MNRAAHALADRGLAKGDRLALLSHNCWQFAVLAFATARLGVVLVPVNFMLGADEIAFILDHSGAAGMVAEDALAPTAEEALAAAGRRRAGCAAGSGWPAPAPTAGWEDVDGWCEPTATPREPDVAVGDDDPLRLMYTSGTESRPKGVMLSSRSLIAQYVSCVVDGGMSADDVEVHALPLYHCAQLDCFFTVDVYLGATSVILPGPDPVALLATIERERVTKLFCPPTVWISLLRHPDFDTPRPVQRCARATTARRRCRSRCCASCSAGCPTCGCGTSTARPRWRRWRRSCARTSSCPRAGSAGRAALNVETRVVDDDDRPVRAGRGRRDRAPQPARDARLLPTTRRRPPRRSAAAGSTPATSAS